jgi:hypothetical protein
MHDDQQRTETHHDQMPHGEMPRERNDLGVVVILLASVLTIALIVVVLLGSGALVALFSGGQPPVATTPDLPPEPRLQVAPAGEWQSLKATQEAGLSQYAWLDPTAGVAQIPIGRAMELLAATYTITPVASPTPAATASPAVTSPAQTESGS